MPAFARARSLDPRLQRLTHRATDEARADDARSGLVELTPDPAAPAIVRVLVLLATPAIPAILQHPSLVRLAERVISVDVAVDDLATIAGDPGVVFVEGGRRLLPNLGSSVVATHVDAVKLPPTSLDGSGVVIGIIDYGLDYTLDDFRDASGATRIAYLWDQSLAPAPHDPHDPDRANAPPESTPAGFPYGVEYTAAQIDAALLSSDPFTLVRHVPPPRSHGTHVAGIAAGNGRGSDDSFPADRHVGVAHRATIIFVQPYTTDKDATLTDSVRVADAIAYVYTRARQLGLPCVINMSLGQNGGSHDGESVVERAIDQMTAEPGRVFVCAAGNEHVWCGHASGRLATGDSRILHVAVGGGLHGPLGVDRTPTEIELWHSSRDAFALTIRTPDGDVIGPIAPGASTIETSAAGNQILVSYERFTPLNGESQIYIELSRGTASAVRTGVWQLAIDAVRVPDGRFDAFIERDLRDPANQFADQAFFVGDDFDDIMTLGTPATTRRGIAVANYDHVALAPDVASSRGPTRDRRMKPEIAAPGTNIVSSSALGKRQVGGEVIPVRTAMTGTSMSAPHVAGIVALLLQRRPRLTAEQVAAILVATADPLRGVVGFDGAWGFGRVDAAAAVAALP
jgi:subtilisin family serine protease